MKKIIQILFLLTLLAGFYSCNSELKNSFVKLWIEGTPPDANAVDYYKISDYFVVNRTDKDESGFLTNNISGKDKVLISINYFDKSKITMLIDHYESFKSENEELIYASYFKKNELSYITTRFDGNLYHHYRYSYNNGEMALIETKEWDEIERCYCK